MDAEHASWEIDTTLNHHSNEVLFFNLHRYKLVGYEV